MQRPRERAISRRRRLRLFLLSRLRRDDWSYSLRGQGRRRHVDVVMHLTGPGGSRRHHRDGRTEVFRWRSSWRCCAAPRCASTRDLPRCRRPPKDTRNVAPHLAARALDHLQRPRHGRHRCSAIGLSEEVLPVNDDQRLHERAQHDRLPLDGLLWRSRAAELRAPRSMMAFRAMSFFSPPLAARAHVDGGNTNGNVIQFEEPIDVAVHCGRDLVEASRGARRRMSRSLVLILDLAARH